MTTDEEHSPRLELSRSLRDHGVSGPAIDGIEALPPAAEAVLGVAFNMLRTGATPTIAELAEATGLTENATVGLLDLMGEVGLVEVDANRVVGAGGVTTRTTRHVLELDGIALHTWCAIDVFGIPAGLGADAQATSTCSWCDAPQRVAFVLGETHPDRAELRVWLPRLACSHVRSEFCTQANLFCNEEHLAAWRAQAGHPAGEALGIADTVALGRAAFSKYATPPTRPTPKENPNP
ncbi:MAG: organomercurial lyase [Acidimicrobiia bacterium]